MRVNWAMGFTSTIGSLQNWALTSNKQDTVHGRSANVCMHACDHLRFRKLNAVWHACCCDKCRISPLDCLCVQLTGSFKKLGGTTYIFCCNKKNELKVLKYVASSIIEASDISEMLGSRLRLHVWYSPWGVVISNKSGSVWMSVCACVGLHPSHNVHSFYSLVCNIT